MASAVLLALEGRRDGPALTAGGSALAGLLPVANRPLLHHAVDALVAAGADPVVVACTASSAPLVREALPAGAVGLVEVPADAGPVGALLAAWGLLPEGPVVSHTDDALVLEGLAGALRRFGEDGADLLAVGAPPVRARVAARGWAPPPMPPAAAPRPAGVQVLGARALAAAERLERERGAAALLEDLPDAVRRAGGRAEEVAGAGAWRYEGDPGALLALNVRLLDRLAGAPLPEGLEAVEAQGRVVVDPTARLRAVKLRGPVLIGPGARVQDSYLGPYTCIGAGARLDGAEVEHSIVMAGAEVGHVGRRIDESVIGAGAHVTRAFTMPSALRLHLGAAGRVLLS